MAGLTDRRRYANTSPEASLLVGINASITTFALSTDTGWPAVPFTAAIDYLGAVEEVVLVTGLSGATVTECTRGYDGSAAQPHDAGAAFVHTTIAQDADEANLHSSEASGHGTVGDVVGTTDVQTLTSKTILSSLLEATATEQAVKAHAAASGAASLIEGFDSTGAVLLFKVGRAGDTFINPTDPAKKPLVVKGAAAQTANQFEVQDSSGLQLLVVTKAGRFVHKPADLAAASWKVVPPNDDQATYFNLRNAADAADNLLITTWGEISKAAKLHLAGLFSEDPIRFPLDGSKFKVDADGDVTARDVAARDVAATSVAADNLPAVGAALAGNRIHWSTAAVTTDASGNATITHGAGFTPTVIHAEVRLNGGHSGVIGIDNITSTQFRVRISVTGALSCTIMYVCYE